MPQNLTNEMKDSLKPVMNMFDIQAQTAQKMLREQMAFMNECFEISTQHADTLRNSDDNTKYFRVPVDAGREIGERANGVLNRQWNILMEARDAMTGEVQTVAKKTESTVKQVSEEARQASKEAEKAANESASKTSSSSSTTGSNNKSSSSSASKSS